MSYIDVHETKEEVIIWDRVDGQLTTHRYPVSDFHYAFIPDNTGHSSTHTNIYGDPMKKVMFESRWKMRDYADDRSGVCESDIQPSYKALLDHYIECDTEAPYNVLLWDIEVDFDLKEGHGYPSPKNPFGEINSISCFDVSLQKYVMFIPAKHKGKVVLKDKEFPVEVHWTHSERSMLIEFCEYIDHIDIMSAWNGDGFDIPYVMERLESHFGDSAASMLCRDGFNAKRRDFVNDFGEEVWEWTLVGRIHLDLMKVFKKFVPGEAKSFALDAVCERELDEKKVEYEDNLGELYRTDPQKFFDYSLHDSRLLKLLDEKKQIIKLATTMFRSMCALSGDVTGSVKMIEMGFIKFCHKQDIVLPNKTSSEKESFDGAIVYDTIAGKHNWMFSSDLGSLYPSTMRMLGLSTENFLFQCMDGYEDYVRVMTRSDEEVTVEVVSTGDLETLTGKELELLIREEGYCISANGSIFDGSMGLLSQFVEYIFNSRKQYKNLMQEKAREGDKEMEKLYDLYQKVYKLCGNSLYGCISNVHFRLFDIRLAKSITLSGRLISKYQAYQCNDLVDTLKEE